MQIHLNGEPRTVESAGNVAELLAALDLAGQRVAVERNGEIVPRSRLEQEPVAEGDRFEIVRAIGGG